MLWLRTLLFTLIVPGTVLALVPFGLLAAGGSPALHLGAVRWSGLLPVGFGLVIIAWCFGDFVRRGRGTPAPYDPPRELVVAGLYRCVRNPQYVGVFLVTVGEALLAESVVLLGYAALLVVAYNLFVRYYEEPTLGRLFGSAYARYRESVPRWLPRWPIDTAAVADPGRRGDGSANS
jgi:protein-S-isoprenylcysteine O-methyltransferase Ste14